MYAKEIHITPKIFFSGPRLGKVRLVREVKRNSIIDNDPDLKLAECVNCVCSKRNMSHQKFPLLTNAWLGAFSAYGEKGDNICMYILNFGKNILALFDSWQGGLIVYVLKNNMLLQKCSTLTNTLEVMFRLT